MKNSRHVLLSTAFLILLILSCDAYSQAKLPRFESAPCPTGTVKLPPDVKPECGFLVVAQDRSKPEGRTFRLAVAILHPVPLNPTAPPVVLLHGGPSGPGGVTGAEGRRALMWAQKLKRDVIAYDQRGAGLSEPKLCVDVTTRPDNYLQAKTDNEREEVGSTAAQRCIASLRENGIDPDMFGSEINALDLADLRKVLGISKWDLVGVSYGARLVQEAIRNDPAGIRSVVMHSSSIISGGSHSDEPLTRQRLVEHIFALCKAQAECASAFPTFEKDFYALYEELKQKPIDITIDDARGPISIRLDGFRFIRTVTNPGIVRVAKLPILIKELKSGDRIAAAQFLLARRVGGGVGNNTLTELVGCYDGYGPVYAKRVAEVKRQVRAEFQSLSNSLEQCPSWHKRFASEADHVLVKSDIPALVLSSEFDDRTPTEHDKRIASALKNSYHFELPGLTHGVGLNSGCGESIALSFLQDPSKKPDVSCIAAMPGVKFELKRLQSPTLFFDVTSADGKASPFTGSWGAIYPPIESPLRFELKATGDVLTGTYRTPAVFEIYEGTIGSDTISFKIKSALGDRTITFTGKLKGNEIMFQRTVEVRPGGNSGGPFIWGAGGPKTFTATRVGP